MSRSQKPTIIHNLNRLKGLRKKHSKGCFGKPKPKLSQQLDLRIIPRSKRTLDQKQAKTELIENKEVTKINP